MSFNGKSSVEALTLEGAEIGYLVNSFSAFSVVKYGFISFDYRRVVFPGQEIIPTDKLFCRPTVKGGNYRES